MAMDFSASGRWRGEHAAVAGTIERALVTVLNRIPSPRNGGGLFINSAVTMLKSFYLYFSIYRGTVQ
jgi:hypothetical protein